LFTGGIDVSKLNKIVQWVCVAAAGAASFLFAVAWPRADTASKPAWVEPVTKEDVRPAVEPVAPSGTGTVHADNGLALPDRTRAIPQPGGDAIAKLSWVAPAPVAVARPVVSLAPPEPVLPVAPALPFTFVGLLEQGTAKPQAFLAKGNTLLVVSAGDVIDADTYRVDALGAQHIQLTYLPLNTQQTLNILGASK
jgi:hypothetical protein